MRLRAKHNKNVFKKLPEPAAMNNAKRRLVFLLHAKIRPQPSSNNIIHYRSLTAMLSHRKKQRSSLDVFASSQVQDSEINSMFV
jgi:hypothetical protein